MDTDALDVIRKGFVALAEGLVSIPPVLSMIIAEQNGEVDVKTSYIQSVPQFAIKVSPGFIDNPKVGLPSVNELMILFSSKTRMIEVLLLDKGYLSFIDNPKLGLPSVNELMILFSSKTGMIEVLLLDKGYLTEICTALAGAMAAENLAKSEIQTIGIIGAGAQACLQARAHLPVRKIELLQVWSRNQDKSELYCKEMEAMLKIPVTIQTDRHALVES